MSNEGWVEVLLAYVSAINNQVYHNHEKMAEIVQLIKDEATTEMAKRIRAIRDEVNLLNEDLRNCHLQ